VETHTIFGIKESAAARRRSSDSVLSPSVITCTQGDNNFPMTCVLRTPMFAAPDNNLVFRLYAFAVMSDSRPKLC